MCSTRYVHEADLGKAVTFPLTVFSPTSEHLGLLLQRQSRNSIIGEEYRWPRTVPYYMEDDLGERIYRRKIPLPPPRTDKDYLNTHNCWGNALLTVTTPGRIFKNVLWVLDLLIWLRCS